MSKARILVADNNRNYGAVVKRYLEGAGFEVCLVTSVSEARNALGKQDIDLAVLDIRLEDDDEALDRTGLSLAAEETFLSVPKILLTAFPEYEAEFMTPVHEGRLPVAFDFVPKNEGPERLLVSVSKALSIIMAAKKHMAAERPRAGSGGTEIFLVHGHDEEAKHELAHFLHRLGLVPVILSEIAAGGAKAIIELIEDSSAVTFAIIIMTPDDFCASNTEPKRRAHRARQNVVFEAGYFIGRLGRSRICVLRKGEVEIPSDLHGVFYVPMDPGGGWKLPIARQLKAAGFDIKLDGAL